MDGVLCDFDGQCQRLLGYKMEPHENVTQYMERNDICKRDFWEAVRVHGETFWSTMPVLPNGIEAYHQLCQLGRVVILSSPDMNNYDECKAGKEKWLQKYLGPGKVDARFTPNKYTFADEFAVLIDDNLDQCLYWEQYKGKAILFNGDWRHVFKQLGKL